MTRLWLMGNGSAPVRAESSVVGKSAAQSWSFDVAPARYVYRLESGANSSNRAGRATSVMVTATDTPLGFANSGFGQSDLLLATHVRSDRSAKRWTDFEAAPVVGAIERTAPFHVVWETYDAGERDGRAEYDVTVTIKGNHGEGGGLAARIVTALASVVRSDRRPDEVTTTYARSMPYSRTLADEVEIAWDKSPSGTYTISVAIADRVSGKKAERTASVVVRGD